MSTIAVEKIGLEQVRALLWRAVQTQGRDFVYNPDGGTCRNVPSQACAEDDPRRRTGCLVGTAMSLSGRIDDMQYFAEGSVDVFGGHLTEAAVDYLAVAQEIQDNGGTWGAAYDQAEELAESGVLCLAGRGIADGGDL